MSGYIKYPQIDQYIRTPKLGDNAGIIGCLALAREEILHIH